MHVCAVGRVHHPTHADNYMMSCACRAALGERVADLMQEEVDTSYSCRIRDAAAKLDDRDKQHEMLRCIEFAPILASIPATALHIGFNGAVAPHRDGRDVKSSLLVWHQVGGARTIACGWVVGGVGGG